MIAVVDFSKEKDETFLFSSFSFSWSVLQKGKEK